MYERIASNRRRSIAIVAVFVLIVLGLGWLFGDLTGYGWFGLAIAGVVAAVSAVGSYYNSDKLVLAMSGARPADRAQHAHLLNTVEGLAIAAGLPKPPRVYVIEDSAPNAFATGRDPEHAVIAVTTGLVEKLGRYELEGVVAHEMSHIKNFDIRLMTLCAVLVGITALLSDWLMRSLWWGGGRSRRSRRSSGSGLVAIVGLVAIILAPIVAKLMQLAVSRKREFLADADAAMLTRYPEGLASALQKISWDAEPLEAANKATAHLYIVNPLKEHGGKLNNLFSTHPPINERIRALRSM